MELFDSKAPGRDSSDFLEIRIFGFSDAVSVNYPTLKGRASHFIAKTCITET
jgi:hypothetical protein